MQTITIKRTAARNTLTDTAGVVHDLSRFFTVTRDRQGVRADRAGEFHRGIINPVRALLFVKVIAPPNCTYLYYGAGNIGPGPPVQLVYISERATSAPPSNNLPLLRCRQHPSPRDSASAFLDTWAPPCAPSGVRPVDNNTIR
jgi:hypothetical protein